MSSGQHFFGGVEKPAPLLDYWSYDLVAENLIKAFKMLDRITPGDGGSSAWPPILREYGDIVDELAGGETFKSRNQSRLILTADQVSRVDDVMDWQRRYLRDQPGPSRVLAIWVRCKISKSKFQDACRASRINRHTAYRARDRAVTLICSGLIADDRKPFSMDRYA